MRRVLTRNIEPEAEDAERKERLLALLATGLGRLFSQSFEQDSPPHSVDYSEGLSLTTNTPEGSPPERT